MRGMWLRHTQEVRGCGGDVGGPVLDSAVRDALRLAASCSDAIRRIAHHSVHHLKTLLVVSRESLLDLRGKQGTAPTMPATEKHRREILMQLTHA